MVSGLTDLTLEEGGEVSEDGTAALDENSGPYRRLLVDGEELEVRGNLSVGRKIAQKVPSGLTAVAILAEVMATGECVNRLMAKDRVRLDLFWGGDSRWIGDARLIEATVAYDEVREEPFTLTFHSVGPWTLERRRLDE
jgi:hypothetical protein